MTTNTAFRSFADIVVAYTVRNVVPSDNDDKIAIAVTVPGGYTGFGPTPDDACKMAMSRAKIAFAHAKKGMGGSLTEAEWFKAIYSRYSPALIAYLTNVLESAKRDAKHDAKHDGCDNATFESDEVVSELRGSSSPFAVA